MRFEELLAIVSPAYPDDLLMECYDAITDEILRGKVGDSLAEFIVSELLVDFNPEAADDVQLKEAISTMEMAASDIAGVLSALYQCKPTKS